ncbi:MAG: hypothetical protein ACTHN0_17405 [Aquihabitans sp.]
MTTTRSSRLRKAVAAGVTALSLAGAFVALETTPASAACVTTYRSTNGNDATRKFQIASGSSCSDLNIRQATVAQNYRGEYYSSSWKVGSLGWKYRSPSTTNLQPVITNVADTTTVRMTGASVNAYAYAVH